MLAPRRRAVTLMEVLIAMFIMAIGMLALLALFPIGAISMATALKDDRCAYASTSADGIAKAYNLAHGDEATVTALAASPSGVVYVDPQGALLTSANPALATLGGVIPRIAPTFILATIRPVTPTQMADRLLSLPDDVTFAANGTPDTSTTGGIIDRGRRYSWCYLLTRAAPAATNLNPMLVYMHVVVYSGRPMNSLAAPTTTGGPLGETPLPLAAPGNVGTNVVLATGVDLPLKRGGWIFEPANGIFYRVTNLAENAAAATTTVELETNLMLSASAPAPIVKVIAMEHAAEVFNKGPR